MKTNLKLFILSLVLFLMMACQNTPSQKLAGGHTWQLMTLHQQSLNLTEQQKTPTLVFTEENHKVRGFAGCNNFFGSYTTQGVQLSLGSLGMTRRYCAETSTLETQYENSLKQVTRFKISAGILYLMADDNVVATFKAIL